MKWFPRKKTVGAALGTAAPTIRGWSLGKGPEVWVFSSTRQRLGFLLALCPLPSWCSGEFARGHLRYRG